MKRGKVEAAILEGVSSYPELSRERDLGEVHPTEGTDVVYDSLGHGILCIVNHHADWKSYILKHHRQDVQTLAMIGSCKHVSGLG